MTVTDIGGVVLAAGASTRMGRPKALLELPSGQRLAVHQANLLESAGCTKVVIVVGEASIAAALADDRTLVHPDWAMGRVSSLQAGLRALGSCRDGVLVLPVDTVGVSPHVLAQLAGPAQADATRPIRVREIGQVVRLSTTTAEQVLAISPHPGLCLNDWLADRTEYLPVTHDLGYNVNTPAEWEAAREHFNEELA